ncbi:NAD-dependent epimerase/dehydratase family protein [Reticulomyxa filosa]|uniref:NAD-dependent epimerase/dehydratase family protein n=1 Tax=Reticulomyxa filosa TaxID=46433 RepID=X6PFN5_RETFI|nr:NAD-dependent epimerase/dehydratase family protein [Reticulomyxa filosa]|eukprot:ETO36883.1 NAD-dependent epimerase/dehydratase family protein [Reticulomyxa filosa]
MTQVQTENDEKRPELPRVMILGGCGFIGRHLVHYLVTQKAVSEIKVVDKRAPLTASFSKAMLDLFKNPVVKMIQCDLSRADLIDKKNLFNEPVEYIINVCGETRFGQSDQDYQTKCVDTAVKCAERAAKMKGLIKWIEVSTAQVYEPKETPGATETSTIEPYTKLASFRLKVEKKLEDFKFLLINYLFFYFLF